MLGIIILIGTFCKLSECILFNYNTTYILSYVKNRNYPIELHTIQTNDGYILNIHRIPFSRNNVSGAGVVLLVHGLQESAEHWIINDNKSLAFLLSNQGYDVWMLNSRGCYHSINHVTLDKSDPNYWDFSWHEVGIYDLPKTIDYILNATNRTKIFYIGHSQGATSFFVLTSLKPDYNNKIKIMIGLAPAAYMSHVRNPVYRSLSRIWELIYTTKKPLLDNVLVNNIAELICKEQNFLQNVCTNALFLMAGYNYEQLDKTLVSDIMRIMPAGSSTKQLVHYLQLVKSGYFRQYDYFPRENFLRYNRSNPPKYNLSNVTAKIALYYAKNDWLATSEDVRRLRDELPNVVVDHLVEYELFNHWDFLFAKDVIPLLYNNVLDLLNEHK